MNGSRETFLAELGERVRALRGRRGLTRKALAAAAGVSERHLANLESGGNPTIAVLANVAGALNCPLAEVIGDVTTSSPEWQLLREQLARVDEAALRRVRVAAVDVLGLGSATASRASRVALVGLRGAGKSTLGKMLSLDLGFPFVEMSRHIEALAGCSTPEIQALYGVGGYRRYERRALEEIVAAHAAAVIATPGGIVSDPGTYHALLGACTTVWLQASPADHMLRVVAQGDLRPMHANPEAMEDLRAILAARAALYARADFSIDTSAAPLGQTFATLRETVRDALRLAA